jgi:hypothetical protein
MTTYPAEIASTSDILKAKRLPEVHAIEQTSRFACTTKSPISVDSTGSQLQRTVSRKPSKERLLEYCEGYQNTVQQRITAGTPVAKPDLLRLSKLARRAEPSEYLHEVLTSCPCTLKIISNGEEFDKGGRERTSALEIRRIASKYHAILGNIP